MVEVAGATLPNGDCGTLLAKPLANAMGAKEKMDRLPNPSETVFPALSHFDGQPTLLPTLIWSASGVIA
jgi:hypothetical protein